MTLQDALFNDGIELSRITKASLCGATLNPIKRYGDTINVISIGSAAAVASANMFKENPPYSKEYDIDGNLEVIINWHFLIELRRQLAGTIEEGTSTFSPEEATFYEDFQLWAINGTVYDGEYLTAIEYLDDWLVDELTGTEHPTLNRDYGENHKWNKIYEREEV